VYPGRSLISHRQLLESMCFTEDSNWSVLSSMALSMTRLISIVEGNDCTGGSIYYFIYRYRAEGHMHKKYYGRRTHLRDRALRKHNGNFSAHAAILFQTSPFFAMKWCRCLHFWYPTRTACNAQTVTIFCKKDNNTSSTNLILSQLLLYAAVSTGICTDI